VTAKAERKAKQVERQRIDDMRDVMKTDQGKRVIWGILELSGMMSKNLHKDSNSIARHEGARCLGLDIHAWVMEAAPGSFLKIQEGIAKAHNFEEENDEDDKIN
jgi:hypothetical protein